MDRTIEQEFRKDIKDINKKLTSIEVAIGKLTVRQNTGMWVFKTLLTVIVASASGFFGAHLSK